MLPFAKRYISVQKRGRRNQFREKPPPRCSRDLISKLSAAFHLYVFVPCNLSLTNVLLNVTRKGLKMTQAQVAVARWAAAGSTEFLMIGDDKSTTVKPPSRRKITNNAT